MFVDCIAVPILPIVVRSSPALCIEMSIDCRNHSSTYVRVYYKCTSIFATAIEYEFRPDRRRKVDHFTRDEESNCSRFVRFGIEIVKLSGEDEIYNYEYKHTVGTRS